MEKRCRRFGMPMKRAGYFVLAALVVLSAIGLTGYACADGGYRGGSGWSHGGGHYYGGGSGHYRGGHGGWRGGVWIGPGWGWGGWGPWWWGAPYYPYYPTPPVVIEREPPVYIETAPEPEEESYWYYCRNPRGYYPYITQCPGGWMKVVPSPVPPD